MIDAASHRALDALAALGSAWRGDWSDFDGRTLRHQLESWRELMRRSMSGEAADDEADLWVRSEGICPLCRSWWEHCNDRASHESGAGDGG